MCESKVMKMNKKEKLDNMLCEKNGVLQTADVIEAAGSRHSAHSSILWNMQRKWN